MTAALDVPPEGKACFANLEARASGVVERDGKQTLVYVPRDGIERLEFAHGFVAERQWLQLPLGALLTVGGGYSFANWFAAMSSRAPMVMPARMGAATVFACLAGLVILGFALRRGPHLRVVTANGTRKLIVRGRHDERDRERFLADARRILGI